MKLFRFRACLSAAATVLAFAVHGQQASPASGPTWPDALEAAWQRSPDHPERQGQLRRAEAQRTAADSPWAGPPALELDHRSGRQQPNGSLRETEVGVTWPLWLPGQRQASLGAAQAELRSAERALDAAKWRLAGELREAGGSLLAQQAQARQAELQVRLFKALADDVDRRVQAGDLARADAMAARAEVLQAEVQHHDALQRLQLARSRWSLLTGLEAVPATDSPAADTAAGEHPELTAAMLNVERARRRLEVAETSRRDPPEVGVHLRRDTDSSGSATSAGVSLRWPFATASRNAPVLAQARSELDIAVAEEQRVRDRIASDIQSARMQVESTERQLQAEQARAGLLRQRAELVEKSFRAGETALPEVLRALAAAAQADAAVVRQQAALDQVRTRLSHTLGWFP